VFEPSIPPEWRTFLRLSGIVAGQGAHVDVDALDSMVVQTLIQRALAAPGSRVAGRDAGELLQALEPRRGPERIIDLLLRVGPYGDAFGEDPDGLTLDVLERQPHGIDLGPLEPRLPEMLRTPSGKVELMPEPIVVDVERLRGLLTRARTGPSPNRAHSAEPSASGLVLIGRRQLRSNNSWMHNLPALVKGKDRCTLHIHPDDARRLGLADGGRALVRSRAGQVEAPVELTDGIMPGVVSIPHGWGHDEDGVRLGVASAHAGVNSNVLADESLVDPLSGNAVLNGIPVDVAAAPAE
jgi:anaerobic selenocysteine-containing dehydrogenase